MTLLQHHNKQYFGHYGIYKYVSKSWRTIHRRQFDFIERKKSFVNYLLTIYNVVSHRLSHLVCHRNTFLTAITFVYYCNIIVSRSYKNLFYSFLFSVVIRLSNLYIFNSLYISFPHGRHGCKRMPGTCENYKYIYIYVHST